GGGAVEEPAPVGGEGGGEPDGDAERAGGVGGGCVGGGYQVGIHHDRGGIHEGAVSRVKVGAEVDDGGMALLARPEPCPPARQTCVTRPQKWCVSRTQKRTILAD